MLEVAKQVHGRGSPGPLAGGHLPSATPRFAKFCAHFCSNFCSFRASRALLVPLPSVAWPWLASGKTTGPHPRPRRRSRLPSKEAACCSPAWCAGFPCPHSGAGRSTAGLRTHWLTGPSPPGRGPQASGKCRGLSAAAAVMGLAFQGAVERPGNAPGGMRGLTPPGDLRMVRDGRQEGAATDRLSLSLLNGLPGQCFHVSSSKMSCLDRQRPSVASPRAAQHHT